MPDGVVRAVYVAAEAGQPVSAVPRVRAVPGQGLEGDRYFFGRGHFSRWPGTGRQVTLIEEEVIEAVRREHGLDLDEGRSRRNLVTAGLRLNDLVGRRFRVGTAVLRGMRLCPPCDYLEGLLGAEVMEALKGRGGLRADVVEEGIIEVGAGVAVVPE